MLTLKTKKSLFRTLQLFLASLVAGAVSYDLAKYYDTLNPIYFIVMLITLCISMILIFFLHYILPDEIQ